jgi:succinoglycan biosynthesis protein ExoV
MEYLYYRSEKGNFGDDLNPWLWPQLFKSTQADTEKTYFLGIGSILYPENKILKTVLEDKKVVFGTGVRPSTNHNTLTIDNTWDIKFLRGPLSAMSLKNKYDFVADAAYAIRHIDNFERFIGIPKKHNISVMPYFKSVEYFDWEQLCKNLGYNYISPFSENGVEETLFNIASSKYIITEAMHGAILADALRVPWHRYLLTTHHTEGAMISEFKWMDWLYSLNLGNINSTNIKFYRKSFLNEFLLKYSNKMINAEFMTKRHISNDILKRLDNIKDFYLSNDNVLETIDTKMKSHIAKLNQQLS